MLRPNPKVINKNITSDEIEAIIAARSLMENINMDRITRKVISRYYFDLYNIHASESKNIKPIESPPEYNPNTRISYHQMEVLESQLSCGKEPIYYFLNSSFMGKINGLQFVLSTDPNKPTNVYPIKNNLKLQDTTPNAFHIPHNVTGQLHQPIDPYCEIFDQGIEFNHISGRCLQAFIPTRLIRSPKNPNDSNCTEFNFRILITQIKISLKELIGFRCHPGTSI